MNEHINPHDHAERYAKLMDTFTYWLRRLVKPENLFKSISGPYGYEWYRIDLGAEVGYADMLISHFPYRRPVYFLDFLNDDFQSTYKLNFNSQSRNFSETIYPEHIS